MLAPSATMLTDTALPGTTRRRVWSHPELVSHSVLVLTFSKLHLAPQAGIPKPELLNAVETGDLDELLGPLAVVVELVSVRRVKLDLLTNSLIIEYLKGGLGTTSRLTITFATAEAADACFTKLWRRLGDSFQLQPYKRDTWSLARGPVTLLLGALLATAVLALILSIFEDMATARAVARTQSAGFGGLTTVGAIPKTPLEWLLGWLDWRVVCGLGGVVAAVSQVWLYRRFSKPPASLEVRRS